MFLIRQTLFGPYFEFHKLELDKFTNPNELARNLDRKDSTKFLSENLISFRKPFYNWFEKLKYFFILDLYRNISNIGHYYVLLPPS